MQDCEAMDRQSPGFSSPFKSKDCHSSGQVATRQSQPEGFNFTDYSISECSSSSDQTQRDPDESLRISGYSSDENGIDEEGGYVNKIYIRTQQNKRKTSTGKIRFCNLIKARSKQSEKRKRKSPLFRNLRLGTSKTVEGRNVSAIAVTPWQKVRSDFMKLRETKCRRRKFNSSTLIDSSSRDEESCFQSKENDIEDFTSSSSMSDEERKRNIDHAMKISVNKTNECSSFCPHYASKTIKARMRCRKDGYLYQLLCILKEARAERKFLEHDKKYGLKIGVRLSVLKIVTSFSVSMAIVQMGDGSFGRRLFYVIIGPEMAKQLKIGSVLEAYFSENIAPYEIRMKGEDEEARSTFVQPHKLLLLN